MWPAFRRHLRAVLLGPPGGAGPKDSAGSIAAVLWGGAVYGAVLGSYGGVVGERAVQVAYSAVKVPLLLAATTAVALPSFFVLNTLLGLRADFPAALRAVVGAQGTVAVVLASLAPYTAVWYASTAAYHESTAFNGLMFLAACVAGQVGLGRRYAPLVARDRRHRRVLWAWLGLYAFVGVQMAWVLRPYLGQPGVRPTFFRDGAWGNAYVVVFDLLTRVAVGRPAH